MTHEFYKKVANILAKENGEKLFQYIIHAMDDNGGFLRTRYCYWEKELPDRKMYEYPKTVLVALRFPFDFERETEYYEEEPVKADTDTLLKMQLFYHDLSDENAFLDEAEWSACVGYPYPIKVDMVQESFEIMEYIESL